MSRIGKIPVAVPDKVKVTVSGGEVAVEGPVGKLKQSFLPLVDVKLDEGGKRLVVTRKNDGRQAKAVHGLTRALLRNMVEGVSKGYERKLEIVGVGYQASLKSGVLSLQVGFANSVNLKVPEGVTCDLPDNTHLVIRSADKHAAGQFAANIRAVRPPEPYKGKGIRYTGERVRRKAGKAFGS